MKKVILKIHRWLALPFGIFFSILCFTGMLLAFRHEIAAMCGVSNDHELAFFRTVQSMHQWLFMAPASHDGTSFGKILIGVTALCAVVILISGIVLWWPRNMKMLKSRLSVHFNKGWRRFVFDSHVSLGIYATVFLLLMALTGPTMSFSWYNKGASAIMGVKDEPQGMAFGQQRHHDGEQQPLADATSHKQAVSQSTNDNVGTTPQGQSTSQNAGANGEANQNPMNQGHMDRGHMNQGGMNAHQMFMTIHGGQWAGVAGEIIYFFAALIGGFLPISGYYMWWKRRRQK
jgi:uncharacterized iron-regulated membrane protein